MQPLDAFEQVLQDAEAHRPVKALLSGSERCLTLLYTCASEPHVVAIQVHPPHTFGESEENEVKELAFSCQKDENQLRLNGSMTGPFLQMSTI